MAIRFPLITLIVGIAACLVAPWSLAQGTESGGGYTDFAIYSFDTDGPTVCGSNENPLAEVVASASTDFLPMNRTGLLSCADVIDDAFGASGFTDEFEHDRAVYFEMVIYDLEIEDSHFEIFHRSTFGGPTEGRVSYSLDFGSTWFDFDPFQISTSQGSYSVYLCFPPSKNVRVQVEARGGVGGSFFLDHAEIGVTFTPVELTRFEGGVNGLDAALLWETASETNNAGFEVQMSVDSESDYHALGFVEGHGTTTEVQNYSYIVRNLDPGAYAFRLKQIDFDGAFEYSQEIEVTVGVPGTHVLEAAYPNPFNPEATFRFGVNTKQNVRAELVDILGRVVNTLFEGNVVADEMQTVRIDGSGLPSGTYMIRIVGETFVDAQSVTLLK